MTHNDGSISFYFFDIDDNLLFLPTVLYLWNAELGVEKAISSGEFARVQGALGRAGEWQSWAIRDETFRNFRDQADVPVGRQSFVTDLRNVANTQSAAWRGPSWPLLVHAAQEQRPIAMVTARGHAPATIEHGLSVLVEIGQLPRMPVVLGVYTVSNPQVRRMLGATDAAMTVPSVKKLAIRHAVEVALQKYGAAPPHRFGMSDDDPNNVVTAISAMRDCKVAHPDKRFFVINTNEHEFVKLEIFPGGHPATAAAPGQHVLSSTPASVAAATEAPHQAASGPIRGGTASLYVSDMDRAVAFYSEKLGLRLRGRFGNEWAEFDAGRGLVIGLHPARANETPAPGTVGAVSIELAVDGPLENAIDTLRSRGVEFSGPLHDYKDVRLITLFDQDRNALVLAQVINPVS